MGIYDPEKKKTLPFGREAAEDKPRKKAETIKPVPEGMVRVAAVQAASAFGKPLENVQKFSKLIRQAARKGARIVVLPEAALTGYADLENEIVWAEDAAGEGFKDVSKAAETVDGESVHAFSILAKELGIYLTAPFIEKDKGKYYVSAVLLDPSGKIALHHRKAVLWHTADGEFATPGPEDPPVVDTPFGRIGVMICRDMHRLPEIFVRKKVDIVLHCAAFYGQNFETYLMSNKYVRFFREGGMHLVLANWTPEKKTWWQGYGMSRVMAPDGKLLARAKNDLAAEVVTADIPRKGAAAVLPKASKKNQTR